MQDFGRPRLNRKALEMVASLAFGFGFGLAIGFDFGLAFGFGLVWLLILVLTR